MNKCLLNNNDNDNNNNDNDNNYNNNDNNINNNNNRRLIRTRKHNVIKTNTNK